MGKFHDRLDSSGDPHVVAKVRIELWLAEFALDYSKDKLKAIEDWFTS